MRVIESEIRSVDEVKNDITASRGKNILISEFNKQGKKLREYSGEIMETYERVFLIKVPTNKFYINKSFSYVDLITKDIEYEIQ